MIIEYLVPIGLGVGIGIGVLLFYKLKNPAPKESVRTREMDFGKDDGPFIEYKGIGGSPFSGRISHLKENGQEADISILNHDGTTIDLIALNCSEERGNIKQVQSTMDALHGEIRLVCNKDATGNVLVGEDGSTWNLKEKHESQIIADLMAEARANAKAKEEVEDIIQFKSLHKKQRGFSATASELDEDGVEVSKYG